MAGSNVHRKSPVQDGHQRRERKHKQDFIPGLLRQEQDFIPGLPNDIVLLHIATKVPLQAVYTLTWVSRGWRRSIQSREIYDLRKISGSSQTMAVAPVKMLVQKAREGLLPERAVHKGSVDVDKQDLYLFPPPGTLPVAPHFPAPNPEEILERASLHAGVVHKGFYDSKFDANESIAFLDGTLYALQEYSEVRNVWRQDVSAWTLQLVTENGNIDPAHIMII